MNIATSNQFVSGCIDCPFKYAYDMAVGYGCKLDTDDRDIQQSKKYQPITPDWCPLKKTQINFIFSQ